MRPALTIFLLFAGVACLWRGLSVTAPAHEPVQARATQVSFSVPEVREQRIETIRVGQRVWIGENPSAERDHRLGVDIADPSQWRKMTLRCPKRDGTIASVQMLRPSAWLTERDVQVGGRVDIEVPECGIEGLASVLAIEPCPQIAEGPGRVVTATFHHQSARTFDLSIEGASEPIGVTGNHPVWCEETRDFVRVDTLRPGDHVRTTGGLARVASLSPRGPPESVYNLEVQLEHVYRVGESGLLVHNACAKPQSVNLSRLRYPPSRPLADPDKLAKQGKFDVNEYTPAIVERLPNGELEIVDGVTRIENAKLNGVKDLPVIVYDR
ncbi:ParB N-terminal domain-containing protein [Botrimarina hoheduenensis]|nr:ParB N-terminal domain-containing protein [Botrimarina hoheduenensis]